MSTENIGVDVNNITGEKTSTKVFKIHYSKNGVHTTGFIETYTPAIDTEDELFDEVRLV